MELDMKILILLILTVVMWCVEPAFAAPVINGFDRSTGVISGSGFGAKSTAPPIVWDNLEDGSANTVATIGEWTRVGYPAGIATITSANQRAGSNYSLYCNVPGSGDEYCAFQNGTLAKTWFIQYWIRTGSSWNFEDGNIKILRLWNSSTDNLRMQAPWNNVDLNVENSDLGHGGWDYNPSNCTTGGWLPTTTSYATADQAVGHQCNTGDVFPASLHWTQYSSDVGDQQWHQFQWQYSEGTAGNGKMKMWFDGKLILDRSDITTGDSNKSPFIVGWYMSNSSDGSGVLQFDDAYVDSTWARIELCSGSTWESKGQCEIQPPISWSDQSAAVTFNQGAIADGSTAYLYVVDSTGTANATGYAVTIGESSTPTPVDGVCGSANGGSFSTAPSTNLCYAGTAGTVSGDGPWTWPCNGIDGGDPASCSASLLPGGITWLTSGGVVITDPGTGNSIGPAQ